MFQKPEEEALAQSNAAVQAALSALKRGDRAAAQQLAQQAADLATDSEAPWLILATLAGPEESVIYALKALQINPESVRAQKALQWAQSRLPAQPPRAAPGEPTAEPRPASGEAGPAAAAAPEGVAEQVQPESVPAVPPAARPVSPPAGREKALWLIGLVIVVVIALVAGVFYFAPNLARLLAPPVPTPQCVQPTLTLGTLAFTIQSVPRAADGSVVIPQGTAKTAYWVEGTTVNYAFGLAPSADVLALKASLSTGDPMTIQWADCGTEDYVVEALDSGPPGVKALLDQSVSGITVFVTGSSAAEGFVVHGVRPELLAPETPEPTLEGATQAQVDFGESVTSADGKTVQISVTITNLGGTAINLAASDISLTPEGGAALAPVSVAPALPQSIAPGAKVAFTITFPHPPTPTAMFKLLDFSVDMYF